VKRCGASTIPTAPNRLVFTGSKVSSFSIVDAIPRKWPHLLTNEEVAQVITYLAATNLPVGLLLNFGPKSMQPKRILRPRKLDDWQQRIAPCLWRPPQRGE